MPFAHSIVLDRRRGRSPAATTARAMARAEDRELFHAADDLALFLRDLHGSEQLLELAAGGARTQAFRDSSYLRLGLVKVGQGRWRAARADLARTAHPGALLARAFAASLPFVKNDTAEIEQIADELEHWNPIAEPPPAGSALEAALAPHLRQWLLGLLALKAGSQRGALDRAATLERMRPPAGATATVRAMIGTLRAGAEGQRGKALEALEILTAARGHVPAPLLRSPFYAEEPARYLRAELLQQAGRDREALRWLRQGFADTPAEVAYLGALHLRRAEIYDRLGDRTSAVQEYGRFLHLWANCEPELAPVVQNARARLARLAEPQNGDTAPGVP